MKTDKITVSFSADKLQAIKILAPDTYDKIEDILTEQLEKVYVRSVPMSTRKYIEAKIEVDDGVQSKGARQKGSSGNL